jgi:hypothetical protein
VLIGVIDEGAVAEIATLTDPSPSMPGRSSVPEYPPTELKGTVVGLAWAVKFTVVPDED